MALPLFDSYEDAVPDLAVDGLGEVPLAGRVLDQNHLTGTDLAALAVTGGDLHAGVEVDNVLPARSGMPVEVVVRLDLAEDDAGSRQTFRELALARLLDPFDLDVPEMRLAIGIGIEVVNPHRRLSLAIDFGTHTSGGAKLGASPLDYALCATGA